MKICLSVPMRVVGVVVLLNLAGCASIVTGTTQSMAVETRTSSGQEVMGANCRLVNSKGTWFVTTPGSVTVHRATVSPLSVNCTKEGQQQLGIADVKPKSKGMTWGNLLFGGVIGVITDGVTGAAGYYPSPITVIMEAVANIAGQPKTDMLVDTPQQPVGPQSDIAQPATAKPTIAQPEQAPAPSNKSVSDWRSWGNKD